MGKSVNKNFNIIIVFLCAILSAASLCFSYIFGSEFQNTKFYSILMSVDAKVKSQSDNHSLHGRIDCSEEYSFNDEYIKYLELQRRTKTYYSYYNSLIVSSITDENNNIQFIDYNVDYQINDETMFVSNLVEVCTYYDVDFMEAIGLPLFNNYDDEDPVKTVPIKIGSRTGKQKEYGAYISASHAEVIVRNNGMLEEVLANEEVENENEALIIAFRLLLSKETYDSTNQHPDGKNVFKIQNPNIEDGNEITCTINNIYLDTEHAYMINKFQRTVGTRRYNDYFMTFEKYFKDSIFTFAPNIFNKGSSYFFDIRKNYGNLDRFFNEVTGHNYAKDNLRVELYAEDGSVLEESAILNNASLYAENNLKYIWLVVALIFVSFIIVLRDLFDRTMTNRIKLIIASCPLGIFTLSQVIFYLSLDFGFKKFMLYNSFNPMGNIVFLLCIVAVIINEIIWRVYVKKS